MPLRRVRWRRVGLALGGAVLLAGCSDPAPSAPAPQPSTSALPTAPSTPSATPSPGATPSATPGATETTTAETTSAASEPSTGDDPSVEPSRQATTSAPRRLDQPSRTGGAEVSLESVRATTISSSGVGETGPGIIVKVRVRNRTSRALDTSFVQVNASNADGTPGSLVGGPPTRFLVDSVRAGASAEGTYAFVLDGAASQPVTVLVYLTQDKPVAQFRGRAA